MFGQLNNFNTTQIQENLRTLENQLTREMNTIIRVNGIQGAKDFKIPYGSKILLMDENNDKFYIKMSDEIGKVTIRQFSFKEETVTEPTVSNQVATDERFNALENKLSKLEALLEKSITSKTDKAVKNG